MSDSGTAKGGRNTLKIIAVISGLIVAVSGIMNAGAKYLSTGDQKAKEPVNQQVIGTVQIQNYNGQQAAPAEIPPIAKSGKPVPPIVWKPFKPPAQVAMPPMTATLKNTQKPVRYRAKPSKEGATIGFVLVGQKFNVTDQVGDWWFAEFDSGEFGYVHKDYVKIL